MGDLKFRKARDVADKLGQVWTPSPIAKLLAKSISVGTGNTFHILDLGAGQGALTTALLDNYRNSTATMIELDKHHAKSLHQQSMPRSEVIQADVLGTTWSCCRPPSVIVSNPPYGALGASPELQKLIRKAELSIPFDGKWVRSDAAFLARAWDFSTKGTHFGFIVSSPLISNTSYRAMRASFVRELKGLCVTQLAPLTFKNAEVSAYMLTGQRAVNRRRNILLRKASVEGKVIDELEVSNQDAIHSLDIDYHRSLKRLGISAKNVSLTLGSAGVLINRGSKTQKEFSDRGVAAFHTTDFPEDGNEVILSGYAFGSCHVAVPGNMLIPRVGSRCLDKQVRVEKGTGVFTDCVYRLSVNGRMRTKVWNTLNSSFGVEWRIANAAGSCAKHLPISTLFSMPLIK